MVGQFGTVIYFFGNIFILSFQGFAPPETIVTPSGFTNSNPT